MWLTLAAMSSSSRWLCWDDGCLMWLCIKSLLIRMYVKICVCYVCCCVPCIAIRMALTWL
jgi:hypothetical protein